MAFSCRNCKERFNLGKILIDGNTGYSVVSTQCGHLFHLKCLEGALTNQKLLHAKHGTGPLRRFCPVVRCNADIPSDDSIIKISFSEEDSPGHYSNQEQDDGVDAELKLLKRVQQLTSERGKLLESLERAENETELFRAALDEIKFDMSDIQSFLKDDHVMKKGDLIFWTTRDGTYAPGKILEIRKKPGEKVHYGIVKLDKKTKVSGIGPHSVERDTLILPVTELTTFKFFFSEFFDKFQVKFDSLVVDLNAEIQDMASTSLPPTTDRGSAYYRSTRKLSRSTSKTYIASLNSLDELGSVTVDSVPMPTPANTSQSLTDVKTTSITRSKTIHYGAGNEPRRLEKCRSMSWATAQTTPSMESPTISESSRSSRSFPDLYSPTTEEDEDHEDSHNEFIKEGEKVIWFDTYSKHQQLGTVAAVCDFSPCAIVKFEEHPIVKHKFQYRTVPLDELFPYDLASAEDKFLLAEAYGRLDEFVASHEHCFDEPVKPSISDSELNDETLDEK